MTEGGSREITRWWEKQHRNLLLMFLVLVISLLVPLRFLITFLNFLIKQLASVRNGEMRITERFLFSINNKEERNWYHVEWKIDKFKACRVREVWGVGSTALIQVEMAWICASDFRIVSGERCWGIMSRTCVRLKGIRNFGRIARLFSDPRD